MKQNTWKPLNIAVAGAFGLLVVAAVMAYNERTSYYELMEEHKALQSLSNDYIALKKRWSLSESQSVYQYLRNHPNRTKEEKRGGNIIMQFDELSESEFNRLSNKILNSLLVIKKLTLQRNNGSKGSITLEFES